ncbi:MAG: glycosyltransferase family 4 protein [Myxococcales bacterium]|nr:glycosyltransferase family 4 protein [Myxococcales bacterium]
MRIVYAYDRILPANAADCEQAINTIAALSRQGADITLLLPRPVRSVAPTAEQLKAYYQVKGTFTVHGVPCHGLGWLVTRKILAAQAMAKALQHSSYDIVYTRNLITLVAMLSRGHLTAYDSHRAWPTHVPAMRPLLRWAMQHPCFIGGLFHSDYARQSYLQMGISEDKLVVAYNGFEPARLDPRLSKIEARRALGLPDEQPIVTYTGHVNATKGLGVILEMARRCPDFLWVLVGSESEGSIERRARSIHNVKIVPWQRFDNTVKYLYAADILCIPPSTAPLKFFGHTVLPLKIYLYLAAGRPIFAPRSSDLLELLRHNETAILTIPDKLDEIVTSLESLMADVDLQRRLSANALALSADLTWDQRAVHILEFLHKRLLSHRP